MMEQLADTVAGWQVVELLMVWAGLAFAGHSRLVLVVADDTSGWAGHSPEALLAEGSNNLVGELGRSPEAWVAVAGNKVVVEASVEPDRRNLAVGVLGRSPEAWVVPERASVPEPVPSGLERLAAPTPPKSAEPRL